VRATVSEAVGTGSLRTASTAKNYDPRVAAVGLYMVMQWVAL
jgi:hypothetical protein